MVEYKYNAWGTQLSRTGELANTLGCANPFRSRGYIYDDETWMYWLRSRYYYPELHRFISADNVMDGAGLFGANLYAYCKNAPVGASDPSGHFLISAGALLYGTTTLMFAALTAVAVDIAADKIEHAIPILPGKSIDPEISITISLTLPFVLSQPRTESRTQDITITYPPQEERKYYLAAAYGHASPMLISPAMTENEACLFLRVADFETKLIRLATAKYSESGIPVALGVYTRYGRDAYNLAKRFGTPRLDVASGAFYEHYNVEGKQRFTRGYKRYKETSGLTEWKIGHIFHSIFT